jgi:hypothetical protein
MTDLSTGNVLHPRQVSELNEDKSRLERMLGSAPYIRNQLQDGGANVMKQIKGIDKMLEQAPKPIPKEQLDVAVKTEESLRKSWLEGMPTQAEMRRNPSGAVDKNRSWSDRNKTSILQWKQLCRRLHASGVSKYRLADEGDISNIEIYRPEGGPQELNMHNEQIPGKVMNLPPAGAGPATVMSDEQAEMLQSINPELHGKMALLSNDQRAEVLGLVDNLIGGIKSKPKKPKGSYNESPIAILRAEAKALGISLFQKGREQLRTEIAERSGAPVAKEG